MRGAGPSAATSSRATLVLFVATVFGAVALSSLATRPAESQQAPAQPLYEVHDLGTLGGSGSSAFGINEGYQVVGAANRDGDAEEHAFLYGGGQIKGLGTLGGSSSIAFGVNDAGTVVGTSTTSGDAEQHAFIYRDGQMRGLDALGVPYSLAYDVNNSDKVVGYAYTDSGGTEEHAFIYSDGRVQDLGTLGGSSSGAFGINDADQVVGEANTVGDAATHAFLYSDGQMSDLGTLYNGIGSSARDINEAGKVAGWSFTNGFETRAFLYAGGQMRDLGTLGGPSSVANGINDADQVVGWADTDGEGRSHAFLYADGAMRDLNGLVPEDAGLVLAEATAINDSGAIVGRGFDNDGQQHAFLLTPPFDGFYQPVDNLPTLNKTKPGKTIPVRFSLGGDRSLDVFADGYPRSEAVPCDSSATVDGIEETTTGKGGLSYNASTERYEYDWATGGSWSGCRQFVMKLKDGSVHRANFIFR